MPTKTKRRKLESSTVYAVRMPHGWMDTLGSSVEFANAILFSERGTAAREARCHGGKVVPCRVRPLTSAKKNAKRTR